jgi:hypothetical protein
MLSMRWNRFPVCSACDEISSPYGQCAIKFAPRMLSIDCTCKNVHILPLAEHERKFVPRMLSMRWNRFRVCSACDKIVSAYAQHMHAIIFKMTQKSLIKMQISPIKIQILKNCLISDRTKVKILKKIFFDISQKKFGSVYAQSARKYSNIEILAKIEGKEAKFYSKIYEGHIRIWFRSKKKFKIISCLCTFKTQVHWIYEASKTGRSGFLIHRRPFILYIRSTVYGRTLGP